MKNVTKQIEALGHEIITGCENILSQSTSIYKHYWATGVGTDLTSLASGDAATVSTKLTKANIISGLTLAEQLNNFFGNVEVVEGDHRETAYKLRTGSVARESVLTPAVESMGESLYLLSNDVVTVYGQCVKILKWYFSNLVDVAVGANASYPAERGVLGADMTKAEMVAVVTLAEQFVKLCDNQTVTNADYAATVARWKSV